MGAQLKRSELKDYQGGALSEPLHERLLRESERLAQVEAQLKCGSRHWPSACRPRRSGAWKRSVRLRASARSARGALVLELFWRNFGNRRQVGACVGLVPQPYDSGNSQVDQGISKQGNRRVRALLIQMAWMWLRYQAAASWPSGSRSAGRGGGGNKRAKRIAIVAVARRLAIALWRYLKDGTVPDGAALKSA